MDDFLQENPDSFDDVSADELGEHIMRARCLSEGFATNRNLYNEGRVRFWVDGDPEYDPWLRVHVDPPTPSDTTHQ